MPHSFIAFATIIALTLLPTSLFAQNFNEKHTAKKQTGQSLESILETMPAKVKARFKARHPKQTIEFFGLKPGMTVVEGLPGGGWYSKILLPYLGKDGRLIGADYAMDMYPKFGFFSEQEIEEKKSWVASWTKEANSWRKTNSASVDAFQFGSMPTSMKSSADAVIFIRALHNLVRFENDGAYLTKAMQDAYTVLKPGGIIGIVQHKAPESLSDEWASGSRGYIKQSFLLAIMEKAGFEYVASSDININPKDNPTENDIVWRLPPTLATSANNPDLKSQYIAIGESSRMTLTFRKPK